MVHEHYLNNGESEVHVLIIGTAVVYSYKESCNNNMANVAKSEP